jgi:hypothetical protein
MSDRVIVKYCKDPTKLLNYVALLTDVPTVDEIFGLVSMGVVDGLQLRMWARSSKSWTYCSWEVERLSANECIPIRSNEITHTDEMQNYWSNQQDQWITSQRTWASKWWTYEELKNMSPMHEYHFSLKGKYINTHFALNEEQRRTPSSSPPLPTLPSTHTHTP